MTVYVFAGHRDVAKRWVYAQADRPRGVRILTDYRSVDGLEFREGDRVVYVSSVPDRLQRVVDTLVDRSGGRVRAERFPDPMSYAAARLRRQDDGPGA